MQDWVDVGFTFYSYIVCAFYILLFLLNLYFRFVILVFFTTFIMVNWAARL